MKELPINSSLFPEKAKHVEVAPISGQAEKVNGTRAGGTEEMERGNGEGKIILVEWEENDPENPLNWPNSKKWLMTNLLCAMCLFIGLATSSYSVGISAMCEEFGVNSEVGQVGMFTFNAAFAFVPLFFAPLSEYIGRNPVYLVNYACFTLIFIGLALGQNIWSEIIFRFLSGCFGAAGTTMIGGGLSDIWETSERSVPMSCYTFVAVMGTILAPLYSGFILQAKGWRWIQWVQLICNGALCIILFAFLRETRGSVVLARRAARMRKETGDNRFRAPSELEKENYTDVLKESSTKAIKLLFREPVVLFFSLWLSFAWGVVFLFFTLIPLTFQGNHGWGIGTGGLGYVGLVIGTFLGFATNFIQDHYYDKATAANNGIARPEARLYGGVVGGILFPIGLWIFSWTQFGYIHWIAPEIALVLIILGIYHIFLAVQNYLTDSYGENASSAVAGQGFARNLFAASFPLFGTYMFKGMGYQFAGTLLAGLATIAIPLPFWLYIKGPQIRSNSKFASAEYERVEREIIRKRDGAGVPPRDLGDAEMGSGAGSSTAASVASGGNVAPGTRMGEKVAERL